MSRSHLRMRKWPRNRGHSHFMIFSIAATLGAPHPAAVVPFNSSSYRAAAFPPGPDTDASRTHADAHIAIAIPPKNTVIIPVAADLHVDALGHLEFLRLGGGPDENDLHHAGGPSG